MVRRSLLPLISAAALALPPTLLGGFRPVAEGERAPVAISAIPRSAEELPMVSIQWVLRVEDLIACETAAPAMRRAFHQYGERLRITTYLIGRDTALARSFLRRERLGSAQLVSISDREFARDFTQRFPTAMSAPLVVLSTNGSPAVAFKADVRIEAGRLSINEMSRRLNALMQAPETRLGARAPVTSLTVGGE
jgi:hypothetical protein